MPEFFVTARSFAAPFVEAETAEAALAAFAESYAHPFGLYAAEAWPSADAYHKRAEPLARWLSNHELARQEATRGKSGYGYLGNGPGNFEIDGERVVVADPKAGRVVAS